MAKTKSDKVANAAKPIKDIQVKAISSVKQGAVTKPSQTPKAKSKELAKQVAIKAEKGGKKSKKAKKEPTPEPSSDESESDEEMTSDSSASSESEAEAKKPVVKTNGVAKPAAKINGVSKKAAKDESESSESSESSADEEEQVPPRAALTAAKGIVPPKESDSDDDSEDDDEDDSDEESEDDEEAPAKGAVDAMALNGALTKVVDKEGSSDSDSDSEGSDDDSDESDESEDSDDSEAKVEAAPKKRKAEADAVPAAKKSKTEEAGAAAATGNLFVGNLSWNVDEDWLTREFEKFGELAGVRVITDKATGRSKGFGYVEFTSAADAAKAQKEMHEAMVDNRALNVDFAVPRSNDTNGFQDRAQNRAKSYGDQTSPPSATLFIGNISFEATEDILSEEFGQHGTVTGVRLPTDMESGQPKGFGYVEFASVEEATEAFKNMKGAAICGRPIRVDYSTPRSNTDDSPRGGRGGRGGGRGFDRGGRGGGRGRGGFGERGGRGGARGGSRGGRGGSTNRGGFGDFQGKKVTF